MKKRFFSFLLVIILAVSITACNSTKNEDNGLEPNVDENEVQNQSEKDKDLEEDQQTITLYYSDSNAINLVKQSIKVDVGDRAIEEVILEKLKEQPEDKELLPIIPEEIEVLSVRMENDIAYVDISKHELNGGSTTERFFIDGIVLSLTELDHIEKVQFLIDGNIEETLLGHYSIDKPFTREDVSITITE